MKNYPALRQIRVTESILGSETIGDDLTVTDEIEAGRVVQRPVTAASVLAAAGPAIDGMTLYVDEFDSVYRWHLADATAADGYRVLSHTGGSAGRWILIGDRITLSPRGGSLDDWARLMAACGAMATYGRVEMNAGTWRCDTAQTTPSYTHLWAWPGVHVVSTLSATAPGNFNNCPFYNNGNRDLVTTTLNGAVAAGAASVVVTSAAGIAIGTRLLLQRTDGAYWTQREVIGVAGTTLTLDRPVRRPYENGAGVSTLTGAREIKIYGNGMAILGTGVAPMEFVSARDCHVEDVRVTGTWQFGFIYDVASRDCTIERCTIDCGAVTPNGYLLAFGAENISIIDCDSYRPGSGAAATNIYLASADNCRIVRGFHTGSSGSGILFTRDDASDPYSCRGCVVDSTVVTKATIGGITFDTGSSENTVENAETSYNQTGVLFTGGLTTRNNVVVGGVARGNTSRAVSNNGTGNRVIGQAVTDHDAGVYASGSGGSLAIIDCTITDTSVAGWSEAHIFATGTGTVVRVSGVKSTCTRNSQQFCRAEDSAKLFIDGPTRFDGGGSNNAAVYTDTAGVARVSGLVATGTVGAWSYGSTTSIRLADDVDLSACTYPTYTATGGHFNRGTFQLNGATPVAVAFPDTTAQDRIFVSRKTAAGTPGAEPTWTATPGTGFAMVGTALDTSTYEYEIR